MADVRGWLLGLGGVAVGQVLGLGTALIQRRLSTNDALRARVDTRAEEAAQKLVDQFAAVRDLNEGNPTKESHRDDHYSAEYELTHRMERNIMLIPDAGVRKALRKITQALWFSEPVAAATGHGMEEISFHLFAAGNEVIGAYLRGEVVPNQHPVNQLRELEKYHKAADEHSRAVNQFLGIEDDVDGG